MKIKLYKYQWECDYCKNEEITESARPEGVLPVGWNLIQKSFIIDEEYGNKFEVENKLFCPSCQKSRYFEELQRNEE